jgi:cytochrome c biogenesis protein CcdA
MGRLCTLVCLAFAVLAVFLPDPARGEAPDLVPLEFYFEPGCAECEYVEGVLLPELAARYPGFYRLERYDLSAETNYFRLAAWMDRLQVEANESVYLVADGTRLLAGQAAIEQGLVSAMEAALERRLAAAPAPEAQEPGADLVAAGRDAVRARMRAVTLLGVVGAGLVDSFNPCAFATLVFFMSLLMVAHVPPRTMALAGLAFVGACYATYFAIGFGLLHALAASAGLPWLRRGIDAGMVAVLGVLAVLSVRDAWRYARTRDPADVALKLPDRFTEHIHAILRRGLHARHLVLGAAGAGFLVTAIESLCTGQVYAPALVLMVRGGESRGWALLALALYNLMFVLPLLVILALVLHGLTAVRLAEWSRRNVAWSKVALGVIFVVMAVLIVAW